MDHSTNFASRRLALEHQLGSDGIAILFAAPEVKRNSDADYRYRQDSDFHYFTGFPEPEAVAVFAPGSSHGNYILFCRGRDPNAEVWTGKRAGLTGAKEFYGADAAFSIQEIDDYLPELMQGRHHLYYHLGQRPACDARVMQWLNHVKHYARKGLFCPDTIHDLSTMTGEMRLFKSPDEIALMRAAARISSDAHIRAMQKAKSANFEYELESELLHEFFRHGCRAPAYDSIVASGENACILHYTENRARLDPKQFILIDAGGEFQHYASDITRTFPKNGKFSGEQKAIYELVLACQKAALAVATPESPWNAMQERITETMTDGLVSLGILKGNRDELLEQKAYEKVYMHGSGHWLGLDVHDVGHYKMNGEWRDLEPNMVLTVEPGIYIASETPGVEARWWGIGVRIEDDVLITPNGHEILTDDAPKTISDIETIMAS